MKRPELKIPSHTSGWVRSLEIPIVEIAICGDIFDDHIGLKRSCSTHFSTVQTKDGVNGVMDGQAIATIAKAMYRGIDYGRYDLAWTILETYENLPKEVIDFLKPYTRE